MTTDYHTDIAYQAPRNAATVNAPLGQLDYELGVLAAAIGQIAAPITTMDDQASAGQKVVPCTATTGFASGMTVMLGTLESKVVGTIQAGVSLTMTVNLTNTFPSGTIVSASPTELVAARAGAVDLLTRLRSTAGVAAAAFPGSPVLNDVCIRTDRASAAYVWNGAAWIQLDVPSVTAFWISPSTGDRCIRSDLDGGIGLNARWNGTYWLSDQRRETFGPGDDPLPLAANGKPLRMVPWKYGFDMWVEQIWCMSKVAATNDGSHYWTVEAFRRTAADSGNSLGNFTTAADTAANWSHHLITVNAVVPGVTSGSYVVDISGTKTSTPGNLQLAAAIVYRLILV